MKYFFTIKRTLDVIRGNYSFTVQGVVTRDKRGCMAYVPINQNLMEEAMLSTVSSGSSYTVKTTLTLEGISDRLHKFFGNDFGYTIII